MTLKQYGLLAGAILLNDHSFNQSKIYYDIDPDLHLEGEVGPFPFYEFDADLDLNKDGVNDMHFILRGDTSYTGWSAFGFFYSAIANPLGDNQVLVASTNYFDFCSFAQNHGSFKNAANYNAGQSIDPTANGFQTFTAGEENFLFAQIHKTHVSSAFYTAHGCSAFIPYATDGLWFEVNMQYVPFKYVEDGIGYTGWLRLSTNTKNELTVHDYAINLTPETAIVAGDTSDALITAAPVPGITLTSAHRANVNWSSVPGATAYKFRYREVGTDIWNYKVTYATSRSLKLLDCETDYEWQIQARFFGHPETYSDWSASQFFSTSSCRMGDEEVSENMITVYPTIANQMINIHSEGLASDLVIELFDLYGKQVGKYLTNAEDFTIDISSLTAGTYLVVIDKGDDEPQVNKIIVQR